MKYLIAALALITTSAFSQPVEITKTDNNKVSWVIYPESFTKISDGFAALIAKRDLAGNKSEARMFIGVPFDTCVMGYGSVYAKLSMSEEWQLAQTVTLKNPTTVADASAKFICEVGRALEEKNKTSKKKLDA